MTIASDLLQQHIRTLIDDNARWQTLIADNILWELAYAPSIGHPAQLSGRKEVVRHATWFAGAVENFHFFDLKMYPLIDEQSAVAEVKGEGLIKSTGRIYRQEYVVPGLCSLPAGCGRQDRVSQRIFRSRARCQGVRHTDGQPGILRTSALGHFGFCDSNTNVVSERARPPIVIISD